MLSGRVKRHRLKWVIIHILDESFQGNHKNLETPQNIATQKVTLDFFSKAFGGTGSSILALEKTLTWIETWNINTNFQHLIF